MKNEILDQVESYFIEPYVKVMDTIKKTKISWEDKHLPQVLFMSSYPPRECGIATYSLDLINALNQQYADSFELKVCALEQGESAFAYPQEVSYVLDTTYSNGYINLAKTINKNDHIECVLLQHEFGFFQNKNQQDLIDFITLVQVPTIVVFHTVLPKPNLSLLMNVLAISGACKEIIVMTQHAANLLVKDYGILLTSIAVIPHGTHLVSGIDEDSLKATYGLSGKLVLSTFGLISSGKGIDITLKALPNIIEQFPNAMFLIIGKTHPSVLLQEGEKYRTELENLVKQLNLQDHVQFHNAYFPLESLLAFLQLTDVYLFTSKDPNQAVSGTFSYALSCGCPVVSTPIPHATEFLQGGAGLIVDFNNPSQLSIAVNRLLGDANLRRSFQTTSIMKITSTAWENSAIKHADLFQNLSLDNRSYANLNSTDKRLKGIHLQYRLPKINLTHIHKMTSDFGMYQFASINNPDTQSGYTLDDNARALIACCMNFELTHDSTLLTSIEKYLNFIVFCQQTNGAFLNYVNIQKEFTQQNNETNLSDSNGRAIWALGYVVSMENILPEDWVELAEKTLSKSYQEIEKMHSPRAMAFAIKGLFYASKKEKNIVGTWLVELLGNRLLQMFKHESDGEWVWFESYLTYANSILPESLLMAHLVTDEPHFKNTAKHSFDFLMSKIYQDKQIQVVSNRTWYHKGEKPDRHGEQPLDVCYTILALELFHREFPENEYQEMMVQSFNWFLGKNHLRQIIYNPCTGGCYDGLEENQVNINQGAESTVCYLLARLTLEKYVNGVTIT